MKHSRENPIPNAAKIALAVGGVAAVGLIGYELLKPVAPTPAPQPAPAPPAPIPIQPQPAPGPLPAPTPPSPPLSTLQNGTSYTFALTSSSPGTIGNDLTAAGIDGALVTCLSGGICTGSFIWHGQSGSPIPAVSSATWISVLPALTGV